MVPLYYRFSQRISFCSRLTEIKESKFGIHGFYKEPQKLLIIVRNHRKQEYTIRCKLKIQ